MKSTTERLLRKKYMGVWSQESSIPYDHAKVPCQCDQINESENDK